MPGRLLSFAFQNLGKWLLCVASLQGSRSAQENTVCQSSLTSYSAFGGTPSKGMQQWPSARQFLVWSLVERSKPTGLTCLEQAPSVKKAGAEELAKQLAEAQRQYEELRTELAALKEDSGTGVLLSRLGPLLSHTCVLVFAILPCTPLPVAGPD